MRCSGSVVATDPSGEIFEKTNTHMHTRNYDVLVFNPTDLDHSIQINFLKPFSESHQKIKQIATILAHHNSNQQDIFWTTQAANILFVVISALANLRDDHYLTLGKVRSVVNHFGVDVEGINAFMAKNLNNQLFAEYQAIQRQDSKVLQNSLSTVRAALDLWSDPDICRLTSTHTIDLDCFRKKKTILYLIVPEHQVAYFSLVLNLTFSVLFQTCIENANIRWGAEQRQGEEVYFFLDEFTNACGAILNFQHTITVSRKRRMPIAMIIQDLSQLTATYGKENAQTIYGGGCGNRLFYGGLDNETCRKIEETIGTKTEITIENGVEKKVAVPLIRSADLRQLYEDEYLLLNTNTPPVMGKKFVYRERNKRQKMFQEKVVSNSIQKIYVQRLSE